LEIQIEAVALTLRVGFWYHRPRALRIGGIFVPLNELAVPERVVGDREVRRAMEKGTLRKLFVAMDSDEKVTAPVREIASKLAVDVEEVDSELRLGRACAIDRPAALAGLLKI